MPADANRPRATPRLRYGCATYVYITIGGAPTSERSKARKPHRGMMDPSATRTSVRGRASTLATTPCIVSA